MLYNWKVVYKDKWDLSDWNDVWLSWNSYEFDYSGEKICMKLEMIFNIFYEYNVKNKLFVGLRNKKLMMLFWYIMILIYFEKLSIFLL